MNKLLQPYVQYFIKQGYHHASHATCFDDTSNTDEWQKEVYIFAAEQMKKNNYENVIDVGCGSAYKLIHYLDQYNTTGIEIGDTYQWLLKNYPKKSWLQMKAVQPEYLTTDLIICSDVIEHIKEPEQLMGFIHSIQAKHVIFSTPERDIVAGVADQGPPENPAHYREWNLDELKHFIEERFVVEEHHVFQGRSTSQVVLCRRKVSTS